MTSTMGRECQCVDQPDRERLHDGSMEVAAVKEDCDWAWEGLFVIDVQAPENAFYYFFPSV